MSSLRRPRAWRCRRSGELSPDLLWASSETRRLEMPREVEPRRAGSSPFLAACPRARAPWRPRDLPYLVCPVCPALNDSSALTSECPPLPLLCDVFARPHREREYGPGWVLVGLRDERAAVGDEEILHIVRATVGVQHRLRRIVTHANCPELVDDLATARDSVAPQLLRHRVVHLAAHLMDQRSEGLLHVPNLVVLVVGPLPVKAQHRNPILVLHDRIDLAIALVVRDHLSTPGEIDLRAIIAAVVFLEGFPISAAAGIALDSTHEAVTGRIQSATDLDVIPARKIELLVVDPPRHVDVVAAYAVLVVRNVVHHFGNEAPDIGAGGVSEILPDDSAGVGETVRKLCGLRVEHQASGLASARGKH